MAFTNHMPHSMKYILLFSLAFQVAGCAQQTDQWTPLFNGSDLSNWEQKNGSAIFRIDGNEIVGISKRDTPNSFLCTKTLYSDFILELEVKIDPLLNSGIQIRSQSKKDYYDGAVHGYQVEVDPSARAYTGGIYDESRRGWLYPLSQNERGRKAFRQAQWNHLRIEAVGTSIRVWLNGVNTTNLSDNWTAEGFIALQVHSISDPALEGKEVRWRNINIKTTDLEKARTAMHPAVEELNLVPNTLTPWEEQNGWRLLWDGKTTEGWRSVLHTDFPETGWYIADGTLCIRGKTNDEEPRPGDIITVDQFHNFDFRLEFKLTKGANSGIKYFVDPTLSQQAGHGIGLEYQLLDDAHHPDAHNGLKGNRKLGALYDLIPAQNLSRPGVPIGFRGTGQWNQARIVAKDDAIEHWLNGYKIVEYKRKTQQFRALVAYSKYAALDGFAEIASGHILLQDHDDDVAFRSIKIKPL